MVRAEHAAYFFRYADNLPATEHAYYGAQTPLWVVNLLQAADLKADYTIPHGAAQGIFWNNSGATGNFLYNKQDGNLHADFANDVVTLDLTVGSVDKDGVYVSNFLKVEDFRMHIAGNTFHNYQCRGAITSAIGCGGNLTYLAAAGAEDYDSSDTAGNYTSVFIGGGFYGDAAQEVAGALAHYFNTSGGNVLGGTRLQFLGAAPTMGITATTRVTTAAPARPALPTPTLPAGNVSHPNYLPPPPAGTVVASALATLRGRENTGGLLGFGATTINADLREVAGAGFTITTARYTIAATVSANETGFTLASITTGLAARTQTKFITFPQTGREVNTFANSGNRLFKFAPRQTSFGFVANLYHYNALDYTLDVTPADSVLRYGVRGAAASVSRTARLSAIWLQTQDDGDSTDSDFLMVESDFAAYAFHLEDSQQVSVLRFGVGTPAAQMSVLEAANLQGAYHIPRHAAKGFFYDHSGAADSRFLSNDGAGRFAVDFATGRGELDLTVNSYLATMYGAALLTDTDDIAPPAFATFTDFILAGSGVSNFNCRSADSTKAADAANCAGQAVINGVTYANNAIVADSALSVHIAYFGSHAQQIAGLAQHKAASGAFTWIAFLGVHNAGGFAAGNLAAVVERPAGDWRTADGNPADDYEVGITTGGAPATFTKGNNTYNFGAAATDGYGYHYFHNTLGVALLPKAGGLQVGVGTPGNTPQQLIVAASVEATISGTRYATPFRATAYRSRATLENNSQVATATVTTHSQVVSAEHAAFFFMYGDNLPASEHAFYGAQTPLWVVNILRAADLKAAYTIPVGAAQGLFWADSGAKGNFLYNAQPGNLAADFGGGVVTLNLTVGSVATGGAYTEDFLKVVNLSMTIVGNTFNNYTCRAALTSTSGSTGGCGNLDYADDTYDLNTATGRNREELLAGGGFYGDAAQEVAGGIAHFLTFHQVSGRYRGGMRLLFLGAAPTMGITATTRVTTAAPARDTLPQPVLPDGNISYTAASYLTAPVSAAAVVVSVRGTRHTAFLGTAAQAAVISVDRRERAGTNDSIKLGDSTYNITDTLTAPFVFDFVGDRTSFDRRVSITVTLFETFPRVDNDTQTIANKHNQRWRFAPRSGGALSFVSELFNYNRVRYTLDVTPADSVLRYGMRGITGSLTRTAPISISWWDSSSTSRDFMAVESDYAAYALEWRTDRHDVRILRYGPQTPADNFALLKATDLEGTYRIPRHAAKGVYYRTFGGADSHFLSNDTPGKVDVDFGAERATLNLVMNAYAGTVFGNKQISTAAEAAAPAFVHLDNLALQGFNNFSCASYLGAGGSTDTTNCGGQIRVSGETTRQNSAHVNGMALAAHLHFYGDHAQQIAGMVTYTGTNNHLVTIAFLGTHNEGGFNPAAFLATAVTAHAALTWDRADSNAGNDHRVSITTGGAPAHFVTATTSGGTLNFGSAASSGFGYHYFHNTLGVVLLPKSGGLQVGTGTGAQQLTVAANVATLISGTTYTTPFLATAYRNITAGKTVHSQVVRAEHAAFFFMFGDNIPATPHAFYGAQTPLYVVNLLRAATLNANYTIPIGAAQGIFWHSSGAAGNFLYNKEVGTLAAKFGDGTVALNLTVGSVSKDGAYTEGFLGIHNLQMRIVGSAFNNYHCSGAGRAQAAACTGALDYADNAAGAGTDIDIASTPASAVTYKLFAGGAFYGGMAQEVAGAIAHIFGGSSNNTGGMRLQFLAARPQANLIATRVTTAAPTRPALPTPQLPGYTVGNFAVSYLGTLVTATAATPADTKVIGNTDNEGVVGIHTQDAAGYSMVANRGGGSATERHYTFYLNGTENTARGLELFATVAAADGFTLTILSPTAAVAGTRDITTHTGGGGVSPGTGATTIMLPATAPAFNFKPLGLGSVGIAVTFYNYNGQDGTINLTPDKVGVTTRIGGVTSPLTSTVNLSAAIFADAIAQGATAPTRGYGFAVEADYAAYGILLSGTAGGKDQPFFRYGVPVLTTELARYAAAGLAGTYLIPRHAAKGFYIGKADANDNRLLSNREAGALAADFGAGRAILSLRVHGYHTAITGNALLTDSAAAGEEMLVFNNFVLPNFTATSGFRNLSCALGGGSDTTAATCGGGTLTIFSPAGVSTALQGHQSPTSTTLRLDARFYGARAQEMAGYAHYTAETREIRLAFLGIHDQGGFNAGTRSLADGGEFTALTWDRADSSTANNHIVSLDSSGFAVHFVTMHATVDGSNAPVTNNITHAFGVTATNRYGIYYSRDNTAFVLRPGATGMKISNAVMTVGNPTGYDKFSARTYENYAVTATATTFVQVVSAEHAAFFFLFDQPDYRRAKHAVFGAHTPLWVVNMLGGATLRASYTIPIGAMQGIFWNSAAGKDYYLHNGSAGALGADFAAGEVTLNASVDGIDKDGAETANFLAIANFEMSIVGNTFNNYHCTIAGENDTCTGTFTYHADAGSAAAVNPAAATTPTDGTRLIAGGGFYGEAAQEAAGAMAHLFGTNGSGGMRLQFIGANTGGSFSVTTGAVSVLATPLPAPSLPPVSGVGLVDTPIIASFVSVGFPGQVMIGGTNVVGGRGVWGQADSAITRNLNDVRFNAAFMRGAPFTLGVGREIAFVVPSLPVSAPDPAAYTVSVTLLARTTGENTTRQLPATLVYAASLRAEPLRLLATAPGEIGFAAQLLNYNGIHITVNLTPQEYLINPGDGTLAALPHTAKINAHLVTFAVRNTRNLLMETELAGFGFNSGNDIGFFRYGIKAPDAAVAQLSLRGFGGRYVIPRHAAKGYYLDRSVVRNARMLSNPQEGSVVVDFRAGAATLNLQMHGYAATLLGDTIISTEAEIGTLVANFHNIQLANYANAANANNGFSNLGCASAATGTRTTDCGGELRLFGTALANNAQAGRDLRVNVKFYGAHAQEIAGHASYETSAHFLQVGFLGFSTVPAVTLGSAGVGFAALRWDTADSDLSNDGIVSVNASGDPVFYLTVAGGATTTVKFGSEISSGTYIRYLHNELGFPFAPGDGDLQVLGHSFAPAADVTATIGALEVTTNLTLRNFLSNADGIFSYVVGAQYAAFFNIYDNNNIRAAKSGFYGSQAPLWMMSKLQAARLQGNYTIPIGAAHGYRWHQPAAAGSEVGFLLYNKKPGTLAADFANAVATLDLTVGRVDSAGTYAEDDTKLLGVGMSIIGNTFNNYHCAASRTTGGATGCQGTLEFGGSSRNLGNRETGARFIAGGAFYGPAGQEVAGAVSYLHDYVSTGSPTGWRRGVHLQFLGVGAGGLHASTVNTNAPVPATINLPAVDRLARGLPTISVHGFATYANTAAPVVTTQLTNRAGEYVYFGAFGMANSLRLTTGGQFGDVTNMIGTNAISLAGNALVARSANNVDVVYKFTTDFQPAAQVAGKVINFDCTAHEVEFFGDCAEYKKYTVLAANRLNDRPYEVTLTRERGGNQRVSLVLSIVRGVAGLENYRSTINTTPRQFVFRADHNGVVSVHFKTSKAALGKLIGVPVTIAQRGFGGDIDTRIFTTNHVGAVLTTEANRGAGAGGGFFDVMVTKSLNHHIYKQGALTMEVVQAEHAAYGIGFADASVSRNPFVFSYGNRAPVAVAGQAAAQNVQAVYLIPSYASRGYYWERLNVTNSRHIANNQVGTFGVDFGAGTGNLNIVYHKYNDGRIYNSYSQVTGIRRNVCDPADPFFCVDLDGVISENKKSEVSFATVHARVLLDSSGGFSNAHCPVNGGAGGSGCLGSLQYNRQVVLETTAVSNVFVNTRRGVASVYSSTVHAVLANDYGVVGGFMRITGGFYGPGLTEAAGRMHFVVTVSATVTMTLSNSSVTTTVTDDVWEMQVGFLGATYNDLVPYRLAHHQNDKVGSGGLFHASSWDLADANLRNDLLVRANGGVPSHFDAAALPGVQDRLVTVSANYIPMVGSNNTTTTMDVTMAANRGDFVIVRTGSSITLLTLSRVLISFPNTPTVEMSTFVCFRFHYPNQGDRWQNPGCNGGVELGTQDTWPYVHTLVVDNILGGPDGTALATKTYNAGNKHETVTVATGVSFYTAVSATVAGNTVTVSTNHAVLTVSVQQPGGPTPGSGGESFHNSNPSSYRFYHLVTMRTHRGNTTYTVGYNFRAATDNDRFTFFGHAEYAAFLFAYQKDDLRRNDHAFYGVQTPTAVIDALRARGLTASYTIPHGGAHGIYYSNDAEENFFLRNPTDGSFVADFGANLATLNLTIKGWHMTDEAHDVDRFLNINNFQLTIVGNAFNNHHCAAANASSGSACSGTFDYDSSIGSINDFRNNQHGGTTDRLIVGGQFYGPNAEEIAAGISHQKSTENPASAYNS